MISKLPTPHHLKDQHKLHRIDLCGYGKKEYIYFLFFNNEIVYVGSTMNYVDIRIRAHWNEGYKVFTSYAAVNVERGNYKEVEAYYINKYMPIYNYFIPQCNITESDFSVIDFSVYQNFGYSNSFKPDKETKDRFDLIKIALKY